MPIFSNMFNLNRTRLCNNLKFTRGRWLNLIIVRLGIKSRRESTIIKKTIITAFVDRLNMHKIRQLSHNHLKNSCLSLVDLLISPKTLVLKIRQLKKSKVRRIQEDKCSPATSKIWTSMLQVAKKGISVKVGLWALTGIKKARLDWDKWWPLTEEKTKTRKLLKIWGKNVVKANRDKNG